MPHVSIIIESSRAEWNISPSYELFSRPFVIISYAEARIIAEDRSVKRNDS